MKAKNSLMGMLCLINKLLKIKYILALATLFAFSALINPSVMAQGKVTMKVSGKILSVTDYHPLEGATVKIKGTKLKTITNKKGEFLLVSDRVDPILEVSFLGYKNREFELVGTSVGLTIILDSAENVLSDVEVVVNTGYQNIPKERATGSFVHIDNELLNRTYTTDLLGRLENVTSGLTFNKIGNPDIHNISIRGLSTIQANNQPLIILDNFPYQGELNNINPNDIESVTVLKDAAASSIWGARAGNGVIVITTKSGKLGQAPVISVTSNLATTPKPDLFSGKQLSSSEFIDLELDLYDRGHYSGTLSNVNKPTISPVVWLLHQFDNKVINESQLQESIDLYRGVDARDGLLEHFYRPSLSRQHSLSIKGGGQHNQYFVSGGWDKNLASAIGNGYERISLNFNNTYNLLKDKLAIQSGILFTRELNEENSLYPVYSYPYASFADDNGNPLYIDRYNRGFIETIGDGKLLDWRYSPIDELKNADNSIVNNDIKVNLGLTYKLFQGVSVQAKYQYGSGRRETRKHYSPETYFTRDLINLYSEFAPNGEVIRPIPLGGILDLNHSNYDAHQGRLQADYDKSWNKHSISGIVGGEVSDNTAQRSGDRNYGYFDDRATSSIVDNIGAYTSMITGRKNIRIPSVSGLGYTTDRFVSLYANASYDFDRKYILSGSVRRDASNLFGVATNQKWVPLWSLGGKWNISREIFYGSSIIPDLSLRATYGKSGNVDKSVTALLTASSSSLNNYRQQTLRISNPPNPDLRWETSASFNLGLDFSLFHHKRIGGSVEVYLKHGQNLMGDAELPTVSGLMTYKGNTAAMKGKGVDVQLNSKNLTGEVKWNTTLLYSYTVNKVTEYRVEPVNISSYMTGAKVVGKSLNSLYAYTWAGLDPQNGNPLGFLEGEPSDDYSSLMTSKDLNDLVYFGSARPTHFGALRNSFSWKDIGLSFNISYKLGYYFRSNSLSYTRLFQGTYTGMESFSERWLQFGDEVSTHVPSMLYPAVSSRDNFYQMASTHVLDGSHIRLQDVRLSYDFISRNNSLLKGANAFFLMNDLGLLWKANKKSIDHQNLNQLPRVSYSLGLTIDL